MVITCLEDVDQVGKKLDFHIYTVKICFLSFVLQELKVEKESYVNSCRQIIFSTSYI